MPSQDAAAAGVTVERLWSTHSCERMTKERGDYDLKLSLLKDKLRRCKDSGSLREGGGEGAGGGHGIGGGDGIGILSKMQERALREKACVEERLAASSSISRSLTCITRSLCMHEQVSLRMQQRALRFRV
jgi:hypothetical protein